MIKKYTNNSWAESGYEKLETVDSTGGYRMGFNGSGEPLDDYTIKGGTFQTKNLCTLLMEGIYINTTNGTETTIASYKSSQFIPVDFDNIPEYVINAQTLSSCHISGYDATRKYCGRTDTNRPVGTIIKSDSFTYGTPASTEPVKYIRICCNKSSVDVKFSEAVTPNNVVSVQGTGDEVKIIIDQPLRAVDSENCDTIDLATKTYTKRITDEIVLTGEEDWKKGGIAAPIVFYYTQLPYRNTNTQCVGTLDSVITYNGRYMSYRTYSVQLVFRGGDTSYTVDDLKAYLREKYQSGNPIKVCYCVESGRETTQTLSSIPDGLTGVIEGTFTQDGTPTPDNPIEPVFKGDLQPDGTYSVYSTYKITIASGEQSVLLDEPLRAVGDYKDTLDLATKTFTKRIWELVFTGEEALSTTYQRWRYYYTRHDNPASVSNAGISNILLEGSGLAASMTFDIRNDGLLDFGVADIFPTLVEFKSYLTQQYANGTPVKVWYVLAEPIVSTLDSIPDGLTGTIEGTVYQSGTPTPNNPIEPVFNGELQYNSGKYKIIVSPNNTFSDIYLGQVPTTRRIKKFVLTGDENWQLWRSGYSHKPDLYGCVTLNLSTATGSTPIRLTSAALTSINTHYADSISTGWVGSLPKSQYLGIRTTGVELIFVDDEHFIGNDAVEQAKAYLREQYANGTPVIVWYVLAEPEVGIFNEPLMQIGEYADSITYEQANVQIPTSKGDTSLVIPTHVPPSEVTISSSGWHLHKNAKKYHNGKWEATSWEGFRDMVIDGTAPQVYPLGTILYDDWGNTNSTGFQIVGYDVDEYMDPDMTAQGYIHNCVLLEYEIADLMPFDNQEAWIYLDKDLPIGTYRYTYGSKTYIFTTIAVVPKKGQLVGTTTIKGYSSWQSDTALFTVNATEWDETTPCVNLGTVKLSIFDQNSDYGQLNYIDRISTGGSNNYYQSPIRQYLNSDSSKNTWRYPTTVFSRPFTKGKNVDGKLYQLSDKFKDVLACPKIECKTNPVFEIGDINGSEFVLDSLYIIRDKMFLLTYKNVNIDQGTLIGTTLPYFINATNDDRIKYKGTKAESWWCRTTATSAADPASHIGTNGAYATEYLVVESHGYGAPAACVIQGIPGSRNIVYTTSDGEVYTTSDDKPYVVYQD